MGQDDDMLNNRMWLSVITAREPVANNPWIAERWRVVGVVVAAPSDGAVTGPTTIYSGTDGTHFLWSGFELRLYPHESESYYRNLLGQIPSIYVVYQLDETGELIPVETSADYVEAAARRESGDELEAVPMPSDVHRWVEAFVLKHYVPEEPKMKRKRPDAHRSGGPRLYEPND
jgi:Protein of unknown function (DUF3305)